MRLRHIEIFDAIWRTGSLTEAAEALHVSQPAASKLLANAEAQLGFKLFERVKGRLRATREAEVLAPQVARLQQELTNVRRLAYSLKHSHQGHLRIGSTPALGLGLLPSVVRHSQRTHPHVTFDLHTHHSGELVEGLLARELDLIVTFDRNEYPGLRRIPVGRTELVYMTRRHKPGPMKLRDLPKRDFIALEARDPSGLLLQQAMDAEGLSMNIIAQVQTHYVACALVEAGCGDTIVDLITGRAMLRPGLTLCRLAPRIEVPISVMVHADDPLSAQPQTFIDKLSTACRQILLPDGQDSLQG